MELMNFKKPTVCKTRVHKIPGKGDEEITIALTGDWHVSPLVGTEQLEFLRSGLAKMKPNLIILQGDLFDTPDYFNDEKLRKQLVAELKLCSELAPTLMVLGNHDQIRPGHDKYRDFFEFKKYKVFPEAVPAWKKLCEEAKVTLLLDEWFELGNLRIFGFFEDEKCCFTGKRWGENLDSIKAKLLRLKKEGKLETDPEKIDWFVSHAPIGKLVKLPELAGFDVFSFGHTHGGSVPRGVDEVFDLIGFHGGFFAPFGRVFPFHQMRGMTNYHDGRKLIVNSGMVFTQQCAPKPLHNLNFLKAAEITSVKIKIKK